MSYQKLTVLLFMVFSLCPYLYSQENYLDDLQVTFTIEDIGYSEYYATGFNSYYVKSHRGNEFCWIVLEFTNKGDEIKELDLSKFSVVDSSEKKKYRFSFSMNNSPVNIFHGKDFKLKAKKTKSRLLVFEVPAGFSPKYLKLDNRLIPII